MAKENPRTRKFWHKIVFSIQCCYPIDSDILRDKTVDKKFMYIPNDDKQNYFLYRIILLVEKFGQTLGTSIIDSPMSPPSLQRSNGDKKYYE